MNTLFDKKLNEQIIERINHLSPTSRKEWGKMSVSQMLAHCSVVLETTIGDKKVKRDFLGFLFGRIALKQALNDKPFKKNVPTSKSFTIKDDGDFEKEKIKLISLVKKFAELGAGNIGDNPHPFFGKVTPEERGNLQWKHLDHHLRQFGV